MRFRCPKNGRFVSEFSCMYCRDPPTGSDPDDEYSACRDFNDSDQKEAAR